jgi:crotonobetainyl-CoA:carnitine CoA-transferase CaiB-like acyl-CoA transferase
MLLADMGADIIRVERPTDAGSVLPPGRDPLRRSRPGAAESMGLGPQQCWQRNPRLVYGRMTGWGQDGPLSSTAGHDSVQKPPRPSGSETRETLKRWNIANVGSLIADGVAVQT